MTAGKFFSRTASVSTAIESRGSDPEPDRMVGPLPPMRFR